MSYRAPLKDLLFAMRVNAGLDQRAGWSGHEDADLDTAQAVLEECARFNEGVIAPLNWTGDQHPARVQDGRVSTPPGFADAYRQFAEGGWQGLQHPQAFGGQGLPKTLGSACSEILNSANLAFALCPLLSDGAIEALMVAGTPAQQAAWIPPLAAGRWTGTMNLTEPQAGSDLSLVRSRAEPQADGRYRLFGSKIFITWGEHDVAENIVHLVLARVPGAPEGVKGLSLFLVPKFLVGSDGRPGLRNDVQCASLEHKLGIHGSPTAVLQFGDGHGDPALGGPGAVGELLGTLNRGLEHMFVMMNAARYAVGVQGVAVAERALQRASAYARERVQSRPVDGSRPGAAALVHHPDVRRMLMTQRALTEGGRALAMAAAGAFDAAHHHPDAAARAAAQARYEFLVPLVKGWCTEVAQEVTSLGVQVHGGMGYIEETGAAQHLRDARILTIYEGTTAIQANDLIGRKTLRDDGTQARALAAEAAALADTLAARPGPAAAAMARRLRAARAGFEAGVAFVLAETRARPNPVFAGSVPFLMLAGYLAAGVEMARGLIAAEDALAADTDANFHRAKVASARFFAEHLLTRVPGLADSVLDGADSVLALAPEAL